MHPLAPTRRRIPLTDPGGGGRAASLDMPRASPLRTTGTHLPLHIAAACLHSSSGVRVRCIAGLGRPPSGTRLKIGGRDANRRRADNFA